MATLLLKPGASVELQAMPATAKPGTVDDDNETAQTALSFAGRQLRGEAAAQQIAAAVEQRRSQLRTLDLSGNELDDAAMQQALAPLLDATALCHYYCDTLAPAPPPTPIAMAPYIVQLPNAPPLYIALPVPTALAPSPPPSVPAWERRLVTVPRPAAVLEVLDVSSNPLSDAILPLLELLLQRVPTLRQVRLANCDFSPALARAWHEKMTSRQ